MIIKKILAQLGIGSFYRYSNIAGKGAEKLVEGPFPTLVDADPSQGVHSGLGKREIKFHLKPPKGLKLKTEVTRPLNKVLLTVFGTVGFVDGLLLPPNRYLDPPYWLFLGIFALTSIVIGALASQTSRDPIKTFRKVRKPFTRPQYLGLMLVMYLIGMVGRQLFLV